MAEPTPDPATSLTLGAMREVAVSEIYSPDDDIMPHCDTTILHAPDQCDACDAFPHWQRYRQFAQINFTNEYDVGKAPCPSVYFRDPLTRDLWGGNREQDF